MKKGSKRRRKKRRLKIGRIIIFLIILAIIVLGLIFGFGKLTSVVVKFDTKYLASNTNMVKVYSYDKEKDTIDEGKDLVRGTEIKVNDKDIITKDEVDYIKIKIDEDEYYVNKDNIVKNKKDVVLEKEMYVRTAATIIKDLDKSSIAGLAEKGDKVEILDYDELDKEGNVNTYKIKDKDSEGYVNGDYLVIDEESAKANYEASKYDPIHSKIKNTYNGGDPMKLDYYPHEKVVFEDNKMPDAVYSLYLNSGVLGSIDAYIEYAKTTKINTFVVDIVDDSAIGYQSDVMKEMSPSSYAAGISSVEDYKNAIKKIKDAGFYAVGRITVFKDTYYVKDHKEDAITTKSGQLFLHNGSYWPSGYSRNVWYYKVALAKEAVKLFGFNEINFDYVRFPDRMVSIENSVDLHNNYNEDKTQAIQRFVQYATDELHRVNTYVSIDVFGESTNGFYTTAYGQYWPAISNVTDVVSGMPYPDHFSAGYYGLAKPWNSPYDLMYAWASDAMKRQAECPTPGKVRTWVQAYDVMQYVDSNGISYNGENVKKEIEGLYKAGAVDGYVTWNSASNLAKYKLQKSAFDVDYKEVYGNGSSSGQ